MALEDKYLFFRRIQLLLIAVLAISAVEQSSKRTEVLEAQRHRQQLARTTKIQPKPLYTPTPQHPNTLD